MRKVLALFLCLCFVAVQPVQYADFGNYSISAATVKLNKKSTSMTVGSKTTLKVKSTKKKVKWSTSKKKVATVSTKGVVTAKKAGTATITAKVGSKKLTCKVTVKAKAVATATPAPTATADTTSTTTTTPTPTATIAPTATPKPEYEWQTAVSIKDFYKNNFKMGIGLSGNELTYNAQSSKYALYHYNSITMENEFKPDAILNQSGCVANLNSGSNEIAINKSVIDTYLKYAQSKGLKVRYHNFVWHSQTPSWFFKVGFSSSGANVTKDVMEQRMKNFIQSTITYVETNYSGVVYAYDVVNEALHAQSASQSNWYAIYGDLSYIKSAFKYAKEALIANNSSAKTYYNDYNEYSETAEITNLIHSVNTNDSGTYVKGLYCDGIGMQCHLSTTYPAVTGATTIGTLEYAVNVFSNLGDVQVTELDIHAVDDMNGYNTGDSSRRYNYVSDYQADKYGDFYKQGQRYKQVMQMLQQYTGKISSVTVWAVGDGEQYWKTYNYPALFSRNMGYVKPAFYGMLQQN